MALSRPDGCAYDCRHPMWGGNGVCIQESEHSHAVCSCDATYSTRDAFGHASCVPTRVLLMGYLVLAIVSMLCGSVLLRDANRYRYLSGAARSSRRITIRFKILLCASVFVVGHIFIGVALAAQVGKEGYSFHGAGFIQIIYIVLLPAMLFGVAMIADFWVESLPYQVIAPGSFAASLRNASRKYGVFVAVGALNAGTVSILGVVTAFVPPVWPPVLADIAVAAGVATTCAVVLFVSIGITSFINSPATLKRSARARKVYLETKQSVWVQAVTVFSVGFVLVAVILARWLTSAGRNTPIIAWTFQVMIGHMATVIFARATEFKSLPPPSFSARAGLQSSASIHGTRDPQASKGMRRTLLGLHGGGSSALIGSVLNLKRLPSLKYISGQWMHRHHFEQMQRHQGHHQPQQKTPRKDNSHQQQQQLQHHQEGVTLGRETLETIPVQKVRFDDGEAWNNSHTSVRTGPMTARTARVLPTETEAVAVSDCTEEGKSSLSLSVEDIEQQELL